MTTDRVLLRQAQDALAFTAEHGGGTFEAKTLLHQPFKDGYAVGVGGVTIPAKDATAEALAWLANAVGGEHMTKYVGTWLQGDVLYIDAVEYFAAGRYLAAFNRAMECGQQAFYDFEADRSVEVPAGLGQWKGDQ